MSCRPFISGTAAEVDPPSRFGCACLAARMDCVMAGKTENGKIPRACANGSSAVLMHVRPKRVAGVRVQHFLQINPYLLIWRHSAGNFSPMPCSAGVRPGAPSSIDESVAPHGRCVNICALPLAGYGASRSATSVCTLTAYNPHPADFVTLGAISAGCPGRSQPRPGDLVSSRA